MAPKSAYSDLTKELAVVLFRETSKTSEEIARLTGVTHSTLKGWLQKEPKPPHRGGPGTKPGNYHEAKDVLIADLTAEVEFLRAKLAAIEADQTDINTMIADLKGKFRNAMHSARLGELAAALRILHEIQKEEAPSGDEARVVEYHIPAGEERPPVAQ